MEGFTKSSFGETSMAENLTEEQNAIYLPASTTWWILIGFSILGIVNLLLGGFYSENPMFIDSQWLGTIFKLTGFLWLFTAIIMNLPRTHYLKIDNNGFTRVGGFVQVHTKWDECESFGHTKREDKKWWIPAHVGYALKKDSRFMWLITRFNRRKTGFDRGFLSSYGLPLKTLAEVMEGTRTSGHLQNAKNSIMQTECKDGIPASTTTAQRATWIFAAGVLCYFINAGVSSLFPPIVSYCYGKDVTEYERVLACNYIIENQESYSPPVSQSDLADVYSNLGYGKYNLRNYDGAYIALTKAIELKPGDDYPYGRRGTVQVKLGNYDEALNDYNKSLELNPKSNYAYQWRGHLHGKLGNLKAVLSDFNASLVLKPKNTYSMRKRAYAYKALGKPDEAYDQVRAIFDLGNSSNTRVIQREFRKNDLYDGPIDGLFSDKVDVALKACIKHPECMTF